MGVLPETKWELHHGMWVKAIWKPVPPIKEQDALYRKWFWEGQDEATGINILEPAEKARERVIAMSCTTVKAHSRRGYQVRAHSRRTSGHHIADVLQRDLDRVFERLDREDVAPAGPVGGDPDCPHPSWYPVRRLLLDTSYEDSPILAYCCTGCAATKAAAEARERVLTKTEG